MVKTKRAAFKKSKGFKLLWGIIGLTLIIAAHRASAKLGYEGNQALGSVYTMYGDEFGKALAVGNFNGDFYGADLAVGVPGENAVYVFYQSEELWVSNLDY